MEDKKKIGIGVGIAGAVVGILGWIAYKFFPRKKEECCSGKDREECCKGKKHR